MANVIHCLERGNMKMTMNSGMGIEQTVHPGETVVFLDAETELPLITEAIDSLIEWADENNWQLLSNQLNQLLNELTPHPLCT